LSVRQLILKSSCDKLISRFDYNEISTNEEKSRKKNMKKKSIRDNNIVKIMRTNNIFSINILIFCDSENESKSLISSLFVKLENIKNRSTFLFLDFYFSA